MLKNLSHLQDKFFQDIVEFMHGFYAIYNHLGHQITLIGNPPSLLPANVTSLLHRARVVDSHESKYDYIITDYERYTCYIYRIEDNGKAIHAVIGLQKSQNIGDLASALPIGILKITSRWETYFVNDHAQALFGLNEDELIGNQWVRILSQNVISEIYKHFKLESSSFTQFKKILEIVTPLGKKRTLSIAISQNLDFEVNQLFYCMIVQDITKEYEANQQIKFNATHDDLTQLLNRTALLVEIRKFFNKDSLNKVALLFLDLDGFKSINDTYGHNVGDELLRIVAHKLEHSTKSRDIVARIGGDEFIVFLNDIRDELDVMPIAKKISSIINEDVIINEHLIKVSSSIGLSLGSSLTKVDSAALSEDELIDKWFNTADIAMYESKKQYNGEVVVFNQQFHQKYLNEIAREKFISQVILNDGVDIYFQAIYYEGEIFSLEALARFQTQEFDSSIGKLLATAHRTGKSLEFYTYLLDAALRAYKKLILRYKKLIFLNVNVAIQQIINKSFAQDFINRVKELQIDPALIYIELTEQALETKEIILTKNIQSLKEYGIKFSIDDFGTGYSSIKRLIDYDFHQIKLDRSFFAGIQKNEKLQIATKVATLFGKNLQMEVLAEGVETQEEYAFVNEYNIEFVQGYFLAKPLNLEDTLKLLQSNLGA